MFVLRPRVGVKQSEIVQCGGNQPSVQAVRLKRCRIDALLFIGSFASLVARSFLRFMRPQRTCGGGRHYRRAGFPSKEAPLLVWGIPCDKTHSGAATFPLLVIPGLVVCANSSGCLLVVLMHQVYSVTRTSWACMLSALLKTVRMLLQRRMLTWRWPAGGKTCGRCTLCRKCMRWRYAIRITQALEIDRDMAADMRRYPGAGLPLA